MKDAGQARQVWRWWLVLLGVLALVAAAAVVGFHAVTATSATKTPATSAPSVPSTPPAPSNSPSSTDPTVAGLPGSGRSVAYVQTTAGIVGIDLATGQTRSMTAPFDDTDSNLVSGSDWVLSKPRGRAGGFLIRGQQRSNLPAGLNGEDRDIEPGPADTVWTISESPRTNDTAATLTLHHLDGRPISGATHTLSAGSGLLEADRTGNLVETTAGGIYRHTSDGVKQIGAGDLIAVGAHHLLTWTCDRHADCRLTLTDRSTSRHRIVPDHQLLHYLNNNTENYGYDNQLSPDGRHAAIADDSFGIAILDTATGHVHPLPGQTAQTNPSDQSGWTSNGRWFLTLTDRVLRAYDTTTGTVRTLHPASLPLLHLTVTQN